MDKIKEILFNYNNITFNINNLIDILDNLTNIERNIVFNKLYHRNNYNNNDNNDNKIYDYTFLQRMYINCSNNVEILFILLKKYKDNININVKNSQGKTLLFYIALNSDIYVLEHIYELYKDVNISINILDNNGKNILFNIINYISSNDDIVRLLLEKNIKIQYKLLKYIIDSYNFDKKNSKIIVENMNILLEYLHKNNDYDYVLEELYKYVIENNLINEDNKEFYNKLFPIKSNTKSAAKVLAKILNN